MALVEPVYHTVHAALISKFFLPVHGTGAWVVVVTHGNTAFCCMQIPVSFFGPLVHIHTCVVLHMDYTYCAAAVVPVIPVSGRVLKLPCSILHRWVPLTLQHSIVSMCIVRSVEYDRSRSDPIDDYSQTYTRCFCDEIVEKGPQCGFHHYHHSTFMWWYMDAVCVKST